MEPKPNTGSFMAPAGGGGNAIIASIQRRQPGGILSQVGNGSPIAPQAALPQVPGQGGGLPQPVPQGIPQGATPAPQAGMPVGNPEAQIIIRALNQRLASISKVDEANAGVQKTAPAPAPTTPPGVM